MAAAFLSLSILPNASVAANTSYPGLVNTTTPLPTPSNALMLRLNKIKNMDKSNLSSSERKALRKELRTMKRQAKESSGGVYLSIGAIIIIILLLILLL